MITKDKFRDKAIENAMTLLKERHANGCLESEADFLSGAMIMLILVNMECYGSTYDKSMDIVPPMWSIGPMCGRSLLDEDDADGNESSCDGGFTTSGGDATADDNGNQATQIWFDEWVRLGKTDHGTCCMQKCIRDKRTNRILASSPPVQGNMSAHDSMKPALDYLIKKGFDAYYDDGIMD